MNTYFILLLLLFSFHLHAAKSVQSYYPPLLLLNESNWQLEFNNDIFQTEATWDKDGTVGELATNESFTQIQSEIVGSYGVTPDLQFSFGGRMRSNSADMNNSGTTESASVTGIESALVKLVYKMATVGNIHLGMEVEYRKKLFRNQAFDGTKPYEFIVLGDEGDEQYIGGLFTYYHPEYQNTLAFNFGYRIPGDNLANEMVLGFEGAIGYKRLALVGNFESVLSMNDDPLAGGQRNNIDSSPSNLYNSANRQWNKLSGGINFAFSRTWRIELRGGAVTSGRSTDKGKFYMANLIYRSTEISVNEIEQERYKEYTLEGEISKISGKKKYFVMDKGLRNGSYKGMKVDIYRKISPLKSDLLATGYVIDVMDKTSIVKIKKYYINKSLKVGDTVRGGMISH